jgi:hypothetical protein
MQDFGMSFHHFGLAVKRPDDAFRYLAALGYTEGAEEYDPLQRVNVAMRHHVRMPDVEVIWPREKPSPIDAIIKGRESLIYHLCYTAQDAPAVLQNLEQAGLQTHTVAEAKPAVLFGGLPVSFHMVSGIGLIELIHGQP